MQRQIETAERLQSTMNQPTSQKNKQEVETFDFSNHLVI